MCFETLEEEGGKNESENDPGTQDSTGPLFFVYLFFTGGNDRHESWVVDTPVCEVF